MTPPSQRSLSWATPVITPIPVNENDVALAELGTEKMSVYRITFISWMTGETLDVGVDSCSPVGPYPSGFPFTGRIERVEIELSPDLDGPGRRAFEDGQARGAMSQH